jgi:type II secretion system protein J
MRQRTDRQLGRRTLFLGFTLVEVLLATTISALLVMSVVSTTKSLAGSREKVERRSGRLLEARNGLEAIVAALRNVRRDGAGKDAIVLGHDSGGQNDRINLLVIGDRRARHEGEESDQYEMMFYLWTPEGGGTPLLMCRKDHALDDHPEEGGVATVVAEGIVGLTFEYYDGEQWKQEWSELETKPPRAVRVTLAAVETEQNTTPSGGVEPIVLSTVVAIESQVERSTSGSEESQGKAGAAGGGR